MRIVINFSHLDKQKKTLNLDLFWEMKYYRFVYRFNQKSVIDKRENETVNEKTRQKKPKDKK